MSRSVLQKGNCVQTSCYTAKKKQPPPKTDLLLYLVYGRGCWLDIYIYIYLSDKKHS